MKRTLLAILAAIIAAQLASCPLTGLAVEDLRADLQTLQEKPYVTADDYAVLEGDVKAVKAAVEADTDNFVEGLSGLEASGLGGLALAVAIAAANAYRNRNLPGTARKEPKS